MKLHTVLSLFGHRPVGLGTFKEECTARKAGQGTRYKKESYTQEKYVVHACTYLHVCARMYMKNIHIDGV